MGCRGEQDPGQGVVFIGATNLVQALDMAILRPGRLDCIIEVPAPATVEARLAILRAVCRRGSRCPKDSMKPDLGGASLASEETLSAVAELCQGSTGAELENVVREAALCSARGRD
eukprot:RCo034517